MPRSSPAEYTPASRTPTSPYRRPHRGRTDASYPGAKRIAFGWQPGGEQLPVTLSGAKSICKPTVPACLVSRRNRTPANGARPRQDPETGMNTLAAGPSVPSRNSPLCRLPSATRSEEHTSELQSQSNLVCRLLLEKKKKKKNSTTCFTQMQTLQITMCYTLA